MPTYANTLMPPPKSWYEFEAVVCSAAKNRWNSPDFTLHGRQGQRQVGVDVYGKDEKGRLIGRQCKNTWSGVSQATISDEVGKAKSFKPALAHLYVATTADTVLAQDTRALRRRAYVLVHVSRAVPISSPQVMMKPIELQDPFVKRDTLTLPTSTDQVTEE